MIQGPGFGSACAFWRQSLRWMLLVHLPALQASNFRLEIWDDRARHFHPVDNVVADAVDLSSATLRATGEFSITLYKAMSQKCSYLGLGTTFYAYLDLPLPASGTGDDPTVAVRTALRPLHRKVA